MANSIDSEWEDITPQDSEWEDVPASPSFLSNVVQNAKDIGHGVSRIFKGINDLPFDAYQTAKSVFKGQPVSETPLAQDARTVGGAIFNASPRIVNQNGNYRLEPGAIYRQYESIAAQPLKYVPGIGDKVKEAFHQNPFYERPLDTALALFPLAKTAPVAQGVERASQAVGEGLQGVAQTFGRRSLGLTKRFLGKEGQLEKANQAAQTALDTGVIRNPILHPLSSGADDMLSRAEGLESSAGQKIGSFLKSQDQQFDWGKTLNDLENLKRQFPADPMVTKRINNAKDIVRRTAIRYGGDIPFEEANKLKSYIQNKVPWNSDTATSDVAKRAAGVVRGSLDDQLERVSGSGQAFKEFKKNKRIFGDTQTMQKGLLNKRSAEGGNLPVSPYSVLVGGGVGLSGGGLLKGIATTMASEWAKRYGSATAATMADSMAKLFLKNSSRYAKILGAVGTGGGSVEAIENVLSKDPEFRAIFPDSKKPLFRKAG